MARVIHFEIHATDPERAIAFYTKAFGWEFTKWDGPQPYWLAKTGPDDQRGINGGLMKSQCTNPPGDGQSLNAFVCTVQVDNVDSALAIVAEAGGHQVVPKMAIPGVGWLAYVKDTEGNIVGMMHPDPAAR
ncbi:MAG: VOC family protein [Gemmataceae bacterium]